MPGTLPYAQGGPGITSWRGTGTGLGRRREQRQGTWAAGERPLSQASSASPPLPLLAARQQAQPLGLFASSLELMDFFHIYIIE